MPRALGWKKDRPDPRDHEAVAKFLKAAPPPPSSASNFDLVKIVDQGQLGSCTVNASGQAIRAAELLEMVEQAKAAWVAAGNAPEKFDTFAALQEAQKNTEFWSRLFAYFLARSYDGGDTSQDTGTEIRLVFQAANEYGYPPESTWPYSDNSAKGAPFTKMPSSNAFRMAFDQRDDVQNEEANLIDYARITSSGAARVNDIKTAIAARHLVVFGTLVTEGFCQDITGNEGKPIAPPKSADDSDIAGGHALCVAGYDAEGAVIVNSWSESFGGKGGLPAGCCKFDWNYMMWDQTTDLWIVRRAPLLPAKGA